MAAGFKEERESAQEDRAAGRAVVCIFGVLFAAWGAYLLVAALLLLGHLNWLNSHLGAPGGVNDRLARWSGFGLVPVFLLLAALRRTRLLAGMGFFFVSGVFTFVTCAFCAMYVDFIWGGWGVLIGTALLGYGIVPTAILVAGLHHHWAVAGFIASDTIMMFSTLYVGLALMTLSFSSDPMHVPAHAADPAEEEEAPPIQ